MQYIMDVLLVWCRFVFPVYMLLNSNYNSIIDVDLCNKRGGGGGIENLIIIISNDQFKFK